MITIRGREISRLEAFSDGVFAFAATLLVVSLDVPDSFAQMAENLKGFGSFALSFGVLVLIWAAHNHYFRLYGLADRWTIFYNSVLLLVVLFYVYPLKFVTTGLLYTVFGVGPAAAMSITPHELGMLFALYGAGFVAIFGCLSLMYRHARNSRALLELTPYEAHEAGMWSRHYLIMSGFGVISIVMALTNTGLRIGAPGWIYGFIGLAAWAHGRWSDQRRPPKDLPSAPASGPPPS